MAQQRETRRETVNEFVGRRYFNYSGNQLDFSTERQQGYDSHCQYCSCKNMDCELNSSFLGLDSLNNRVVNMLLRLLETYKESN